MLFWYIKAELFPSTWECWACPADAVCGIAGSVAALTWAACWITAHGTAAVCSQSALPPISGCWMEGNCSSSMEAKQLLSTVQEHGVFHGCGYLYFCLRRSMNWNNGWKCSVLFGCTSCVPIISAFTAYALWKFSLTPAYMTWLICKLLIFACIPEQLHFLWRWCAAAPALWGHSCCRWPWAALHLQLAWGLGEQILTAVHLSCLLPSWCSTCNCTHRDPGELYAVWMKLYMLTPVLLLLGCDLFKLGIKMLCVSGCCGRIYCYSMGSVESKLKFLVYRISSNSSLINWRP